MCLEDLRLGRGRMQQPSILRNSSGDNVLQPDARRVAIIVSLSAVSYFDGVLPGAAVDNVQLIAGPTTSGTPILFVSGNSIVTVLRIEDIGQIIQGAFSVVITNTTGFGWCNLTPVITNEVSPPIP